MLDTLDESWFHPHRTFLRKQLIAHKQLLTPAEIEKALCEVCDLPVAFDIGDYNFNTGSHHWRLVTRYHFGKERLCFFLRDKKSERVEPDNVFNYFSLIRPT